MPDNISNNYHVVYRLHSDSIEECVDGLSHIQDLTDMYCHSISKLDKLLIGIEQGGKANHWHCHITVYWKDKCTSTTQRTRFSKTLETSSMRTSVVREEKQNLAYTIKGDEPYYYYGFTPEDIKEIRDSWVDHKDQNADKGPLYDYLQMLRQENINLDDPMAVATWVVNYYKSKYKRYNRFQVLSLARGLMLHGTYGADDEASWLSRELQN